jgi:hypothetical protein
MPLELNNQYVKQGMGSVWLRFFFCLSLTYMVITTTIMNITSKKLKLGSLTPPAYLGCSGAQAVFNDTWGHFSPVKNTSYKGKVRFVLTSHSEYGSQPIILDYEFPNLQGPYIHSVLFNDVCEWKESEKLEIGVVYEIILTFRNYRFYYGKVHPVLAAMELNK